MIWLTYFEIFARSNLVRKIFQNQSWAPTHDIAMHPAPWTTISIAPSKGTAAPSCFELRASQPHFRVGRLKAHFLLSASLGLGTLRRMKIPSYRITSSRHASPISLSFLSQSISWVRERGQTFQQSILISTIKACNGPWNKLSFDNLGLIKDVYIATLKIETLWQGVLLS